MRKLFVYLFLSILFISLISAAQVGFNHDLSVSCEGFTCADMNVTVFYPNSSLFINNQPMQSNIYYANYTLIPPVSGDYNYFYSDGVNSSLGVFTATPSGETLSTGTALLYVVILILVMFFLVVSIYFGINIRMTNVKNNEGEVININWRKYSKIFAWGMSYVWMLALLFIVWNLSWGFLEWNQLGTFFYYWFRLSMVLGMLVVPGLFIWAVVHYINDKKIEKFMQKTGLPYASME